MMAESQRSPRQMVAMLAATYGAWLVTLALGAGVVYVWLGALRELYLRLQWDKYAFAAYQNAVALALIIGWLALAVAAEGWYRAGAGQGALGRRVRRLVSVEVALLLAGYGLLRLV